MDRNHFLKTCGYGCLGLATMPLILSSCSVNRFIPGTVEGKAITVPLKTFDAAQKEGETEFAVVENGRLEFPLLLVREDGRYRALVMRCTHQGVELQLFGDRLECPAHGSKFNINGVAQDGPASEPLRTLEVVEAGTLLKINLV